jgi:two-component system, LytTR family, sensor kinase
MKHPVTGTAIYLYLLIWGLIIIIHALLLHQLYGFDVQKCLLDTAVFYLPLAGFGLSYFYVVRYFRSPRGLNFYNVIAHIGGVILIAFFVTYVWKNVMAMIYTDSEFGAYLASNFEWHIVSGTLLLVLIVMFYYLMDNLQRLKVRENKERALESMLRETEMEMLKFQINPHFIFNSLNSISALTMEEPRRAQEMVIRLSDFFRNALGKDRKALHTLKEEFIQVELYLEIERVRFGDRLHITTDMERECTDTLVPALILQPLYENAIKYGLYEHLENVEIHTRVKCQDSGIKISISNPYDSMSSGMKGRGIGLKNVRSRLELMYHIPDLVTIERTKNSFTVHLFIPNLANDPNTSH